MIKKIGLLVSIVLLIGFFLNGGLFGFLKSDSTYKDEVYEFPEIISYRQTACGNGICEYHLGETPLTCPVDCFLS